VPVLKIGVRGSSIRPMRQWTGSAFGRLAEAWLTRLRSGCKGGKARATWTLDLNTPGGGQGVGANPECAPETVR
jgi:hypothetical protein